MLYVPFFYSILVTLADFFFYVLIIVYICRRKGGKCFGSRAQTDTSWGITYAYRVKIDGMIVPKD